MGRVRGEERQQQQRTAAAAATAVLVPRRRGRWFDDGEQQQQQGWRPRCRSCAAAVIADCVALGCCPCAVVMLLGLALVRAPLAVGRRLRSCRRSLLWRRKRVRDVAATARDKGAIAKAAGASAPGTASGTLLDTADDHAATVVAAPVQQEQQQQMQQAEAAEELAWVDEMYRVGHWGFGRVSFSGSAAGKTP